jgi:hypothetical protein
MLSGGSNSSCNQNVRRPPELSETLDDMVIDLANPRISKTRADKQHGLGSQHAFKVLNE